MGKDDNRIRIGKELAEIRDKKGITIRKLGELSGVSHQNITKIENGRYNVSIDILSKILDKLGCKLTIIED